MTWLFVFLLISSFLLGLFNAPTWMIFIVFILFIGGVMYLTLFPILYEKNIDKILKFLQKSKNAHNQFLFHLYHGNVEKAAKAAKEIKSDQLQYYAKLALLNHQNKINEGKVYLSNLKNGEYKSYYSAAIALEEAKLEEYQENLAKVKDPLNRSFLHIEEKIRSGETQQALNTLDSHIKKLRGLKLLSAIQYKKEIEQRRVG